MVCFLGLFSWFVFLVCFLGLFSWFVFLVCFLGLFSWFASSIARTHSFERQTKRHDQSRARPKPETRSPTR
jgi:hypothetical protein